MNGGFWIAIYTEYCLNVFMSRFKTVPLMLMFLAFSIAATAMTSSSDADEIEIFNFSSTAYEKGLLNRYDLNNNGLVTGGIIEGQPVDFTRQYTFGANSTDFQVYTVINDSNNVVSIAGWIEFAGVFGTGGEDIFSIGTSVVNFTHRLFVPTGTFSLTLVSLNASTTVTNVTNLGWHYFVFTANGSESTVWFDNNKTIVQKDNTSLDLPTPYSIFFGWPTAVGGSTGIYCYKLFNDSLSDKQAEVLYDQRSSCDGSFNHTVGVDFLTNASDFTGNYARNLSYRVDVGFCSGENNVSRYVNGAFNDTVAFNCSDGPLIDGDYRHTSEGLFNMSFQAFGSSEFQNGINYSFTSDLFSPRILLNYTLEDSFVTLRNFTSNLLCNDINPSPIYNISANAVNLFNGNRTTGTQISNSTILVDGANWLNGTCSDIFGSNNSIKKFNAYSKDIFLWDEIADAGFEEDNLSDARIWFADNSSFYDFVAENSNNVSFISDNQTKLRVELGYSNGDEIVRYLDADLIGVDVILVCANKQGITHFEQLAISAVQRPVLIKNVYSDCYVAADYTRFAFQDAFVLKAFTINSLYELFVIGDDGEDALLSGLDGSIASFINLDTLDFKRQGFDSNIIQDAVAFRKESDTQMAIFYTNIKGDNDEIRVVITKMDEDLVVLDTDSFSNPNNFTVFFDFTTLNVTDETLFKLDVTATDGDGVTSLITRYFNTAAQVGGLTAGLALIIAVALTVTGLTLTGVELSLGWFGIIAQIASIAVMSFAIITWYITLFMAINVMFVLFLFIIMGQKRLGLPT